MKKALPLIGLTAVSAMTLVITGCGSLELKFAKQPNTNYYVSVQQAQKHAKPDANSEVVSQVKLGDTVMVKNVVALEGHLATDQADPWLEIDGGFVPGNVVVGKELWDAQLKGLPPRGGVKVKNFTSSKNQDEDAKLDLAQISHRDMLLLLGANGSVKSADGKAYPVALSEYIKQQSPNSGAAVQLPKSKRGLLDFPPAASFVEVGPYQEFDMGAGLAAYMIKQAISPNHPVTVYVKNLVDRLSRNSTLPYAYGGYHVIVLKDDKTVNACAAPGGFVFVTTGMLKYLKSEEELALILAHEIGHLEFHHSVRELGATDYTGFALAALIAGINLNDPEVKKQIVDIADSTARKIPLFDTFNQEEQRNLIDKAVASTTAELQKAIDESVKKINELLKVVGGNLEKGHNVEFEAAADRRAVSLATSAGYDAEALLGVLGRIKADYKGFGEAYPANRDELVKQFKAQYPVKDKKAAVGDYKVILEQVKALTDNDLFVKKQAK